MAKRVLKTTKKLVKKGLGRGSRTSRKWSGIERVENVCK